MKMKILAAVAFILSAQIASAQFTLGVKGGATLSKIEGKAFKDEFNTGYHLGGFLELPVGSRLSLQPEVLFNQVNTRTDSSFKDVLRPNVSEIKLNYLSIPIMLNYKLGNVLALQAGPQFGVLMSQDKDLVRNGGEAFKNGDFSLLGGAQLKFSKLRFTGRYFVGLNDINDIKEATNQETWKNQGWQLSVGLAL